MLFCCCLKIERKNYIQKQTISKTHDEFFLRGWPTREREKQTNEERWVVVSQVFLVRKKNSAFTWHEEKTQQTTSEKEKEKKRQNNNRRLTSSSQDGNTLYTHFGGFIFIRKKSEYSCSLLLRSRRDRRCFFQEEILETINNKHRKSRALSCRVWLEHE